MDISKANCAGVSGVTSRSPGRRRVPSSGRRIVSPGVAISPDGVALWGTANQPEDIRRAVSAGGAFRGTASRSLTMRRDRSVRRRVVSECVAQSSQYVATHLGASRFLLLCRVAWIGVAFLP